MLDNSFCGKQVNRFSCNNDCNILNFRLIYMKKKGGEEFLIILNIVEERGVRKQFIKIIR
ncbi:MAG: hypothetical protein C4589_00720 [Peptococcaceae bacterium]|nr:MAG: hypothetical protein C4589_00720 [Peptococcaceae bacterium]